MRHIVYKIRNPETELYEELDGSYSSEGQVYTNQMEVLFDLEQDHPCGLARQLATFELVEVDQ
jgi:hypothetical protein